MKFLILTALAIAPSPLAVAQPVFRADAHLVEITVSATRGDGTPVTDLRQDEIRVFDNNQQQWIASFEKIGSVNAERAIGAPANRPPQRLSIILLDALNTGWDAQIYAREGVSKMLDTLPPGERIAIFAMGDTLHLLHDFSTDYESLRAAVESYEGEQPFGGVSDSSAAQNPMSAQFHDPRDAMAAARAPASATFDQENRIYTTLQALTTIARGVQRYPGQKSLLWVSSVFSLPVMLHTQAAAAMQELSAAKLTLYPIDPNGVMGAFSVARIDSMKELAEPTGGRVFYANNDVTALARAAIDDSHQRYILTFAPKDYREDGSSHVLRLKTSRKGADLSLRRGYIASSSGK